MLYTKNNIIYVNFNYNKEYLMLGLINGYEIHRIEPFKLIMKKNIKKSIGIIDILGNTNILVFTGGNDNKFCDKNTFILYDDNLNKEIGRIVCESNILNIKITDKYILIILIDKLLFYDLNLNLVNIINTGINNHGLISINYNKNILKYSSIGIEKGNIIVGTDNLFSSRCIYAHDNYISYLSYNKDGNLLATSSIKGTIIRIFNVNNNYKKIKELRRGSYITRILNMNFNENSNILICSTINGTIHLFNTGLNNELNHLENKKIKYFSNLLENIPNNYFTKYIKSEWGFTKYHNENIIFILVLLKKNNIYTIGNDGKFYKLLINENGKIEIIDIKFLTDNYITPFNLKK
tara:strand:- start:3706 stop:4755 length:1050 start_codon:yes stop_codon:yes gene_type:complete